MRTSRIKEAGAGYYHVISRVVDRRRVFNPGEKERFRKAHERIRENSGTGLPSTRGLRPTTAPAPGRKVFPSRPAVPPNQPGRRRGTLFSNKSMPCATPIPHLSQIVCPQ